MPRITHLAAVLLSLAAAASACSSDDDTRADGSAEQRDGSVARPDLPNEPHGRPCDTPGSYCKDKQDNVRLVCVAVKGGTAGKGFCSKECTQLVGKECYNVPNGMWAQCSIQTQADDAGVSTSYCAFVCETTEGKFSCPPGLHCGKKDDKGTAICLP